MNTPSERVAGVCAGPAEDLTDEYRPGRIGDRARAEHHAKGFGPLVDLADGCRDGPVAYDDPPNLDGVRAQPYQSETFKRSTDPLFVDKVQDSAGQCRALPVTTQSGYCIVW